MRRLTVLILVIYSLGSFVPLIAAADETTRPVKVLGKKNRRELRYELYAKRLQADKLRIFKEHGLTSFRLRVDRGVTGVIERWRYPELGLEFVFDADSRLVETRQIRKGDRSFD